MLVDLRAGARRIDLPPFPGPFLIVVARSFFGVPLCPASLLRSSRKRLVVEALVVGLLLFLFPFVVP